MPRGQSKKTKGGRGKHWNEVELNRVSKIILKLLPCGMNDWESVANAYNFDRPYKCNERDSDAIRSKYTLLKKMRKPSGDPCMPEYLRRIKDAARSIEQKMCTVTSNPKGNNRDNDDDDDDDHDEEEEDYDYDYDDEGEGGGGEEEEEEDDDDDDDDGMCDQGRDERDGDETENEVEREENSLAPNAEKRICATIHTFDGEFVFSQSE